MMINVERIKDIIRSVLLSASLTIIVMAVLASAQLQQDVDVDVTWGPDQQCYVKAVARGFYDPSIPYYLYEVAEGYSGAAATCAYASPLQLCMDLDSGRYCTSTEGDSTYITRSEPSHVVGSKCYRCFMCLGEYYCLTAYAGVQRTSCSQAKANSTEGRGA